jgi:hypothetical protein
MGVFTILFILMAVPAHGAEVCASSFSELAASPRLEGLKPLFNADRRIAMVNETKGSYVIIDAFDDKFTISFFTSGLFDLYPIRKDGPLKFCDDGARLRMVALDRADVFTLVNGGFHMGAGGPKQNFARGEMPALLKKLHKIDIRGLASEK